MCMSAKVLDFNLRKREMNLNEFELDGMKRNKLLPGELLTHITIQKYPNGLAIIKNYVKENLRISPKLE